MHTKCKQTRTDSMHLTRKEHRMHMILIKINDVIVKVSPERDIGHDCWD